MENYPFCQINKILLSTDFENMGYAKMKSLLTFFISGNNRRAKLSKVVDDFKKCKLDIINNFIQNNTDAFNTKVKLFVESEYEKEHICEKFIKLLEYTHGLLELTTIEREKYIKDKIKNDELKKSNKFLLQAFDLDGRILRNKYKSQVTKIDKLIKEKKDDDTDKLDIKIKDIMDNYDHNSTEFNNLITELGLKFEGKKSGGECEKKDNLVGYLSCMDEQLACGGGTSTINLNLLMIQDRIHFILLLFMIRTIATFIINVANIKTVSQSALVYFIIYTTLLLLFVFLANSNIEGLAELFYYLNTNTEDGRGILRIILQFTCICALIPIPYIIKDKKELNTITLYILILASFVTLII